MLTDSTSRTIKYVAHRGWSAKYLDNSLLAFKKALEHPKINMLETDLRLNQDNNWVVCHDPVIKTDDHSFDWISELTDQECDDLGILTVLKLFNFLSSYKKTTHPNLSIYLDLKGHPDYLRLIQLVDTLSLFPEWKQNGQDLYLASFNNKIISDLIRTKIITELNFKIGFIGYFSPQIYQNNLLKWIDFISTEHDLVDQTYHDQIRKLAHPVELMVYVLNNHLVLDYYRNLGVDAILTDDPSIL